MLKYVLYTLSNNFKKKKKKKEKKKRKKKRKKKEPKVWEKIKEVVIWLGSDCCFSEKESRHPRFET